MKSLWIYLFPALFLPNMGASSATGFGTLEISDYLIFPYLVLVIYGLPKRRGLLIHSLIPILAAFALWVCIGTLSIPARYPGEPVFYVVFGLLKFAKLSFYVIAGVLTVKRLRDPAAVQRFHWALLVTGIVVSLALIMTPGESQKLTAGAALQGYKANNAVSVMLTVIACYIVSAVVMRAGTPAWRRCAVIATGCMVLGSAFSTGRSGWLAAIVALLYLLYRRGLSRQVLLAVTIATVALVPTYILSKTFHAQVLKTLAPDPRYLLRYHSGVLGIDDGERVTIWISSAKSFLDAPLWGAGFFHRSRQSHLWFSGSHNFFLQMFLETGLVGGILMLMIFAQMWWHAGTWASRQARFEVPVKCSLVAAFVGGLGGEYFYGGAPVLALMAIYAPVGTLAAHQAAAQFRIARPWTAAHLWYPRRQGA
jgi:O-antigen ligase